MACRRQIEKAWLDWMVFFVLLVLPAVQQLEACAAQAQIPEDIHQETKNYPKHKKLGELDASTSWTIDDLLTGVNILPSTPDNH